jgi:hypothetical protein
MVIAIRPYGVVSPCTVPLRKNLLSTGPLHHLAYFCHRR